jgi:hypothetical protein
MKGNNINSGFGGANGCTSFGKAALACDMLEQKRLLLNFSYQPFFYGLKFFVF